MECMPWWGLTTLFNEPHIPTFSIINNGRVIVDLMDLAASWDGKVVQIRFGDCDLCIHIVNHNSYSDQGRCTYRCVFGACLVEPCDGPVDCRAIHDSSAMLITAFEMNGIHNPRR